MKGLHIVQHVEIVVFEEHHLSLGKFAALALAIDVAANRGHGSNFLQRIENLEITHIAEMQDVLRSIECRQHLGTQQTVRIADNANLHLPKLKRADQRPFALKRSGFATGSIICSTEPGLCGSFMAMQ